MSEGLTITIFGAISALASAIVYLHKQIISNLRETAKCMEAHARADQENRHLREELKEIKHDVRAVKADQSTLANAVLATPSSPCATPSGATLDTRTEPPTR